MGFRTAIEQELLDRRVEGRAGPTQQALLSGGSVVVNPAIQKVRTKFIIKNKLPLLQYILRSYSGGLPPVHCRFYVS